MDSQNEDLINNVGSLGCYQFYQISAISKAINICICYLKMQGLITTS